MALLQSLSKILAWRPLLVVWLLASCTAPPHIADGPSTPGYQVEIKRTSYGIPHITADSFASLGYGEGYAAAEDHVCNIADAIVAARGERAKFYGAGKNNEHLLSDIVVHALKIPTRSREEFAEQTSENKEWITGYADGYNRYIRETGADNISSWCRGAAWVRKILPQDLFARFQIVAQTAPRMASVIATAKPPGSDETVSSVSTQQTLADVVDSYRAQSLGSNGWAIGKDRTENGRGMLLGNPHYPWTGTNRFWEKHLIIPGRMNLYGSHLIGIPGVAIGFNGSVGWTHTVSNSKRVVFYALDLVPGDPTRYYYDGKQRRMKEVTVEVIVANESGVEEVQKHSVWFSHYGPVVALPNAPWTDRQAITIRDANFPNQKLFAHWKAMGLATGMDTFKDAFRQWNAIPWVNTMATSHDGRAVYIDGSNVGRLSKQAISRWQKQINSNTQARSFYRQAGAILLDGSDSRFEWQAHPDARIAGVVPFIEQPQQERTDYIFNANDSHWLTNVQEPLVGYSPLYGAEETARSLRTRMNAALLMDTSPDGPAGVDGKFSMREIQQALFSNRSLTAELLLGDLLHACARTPSVSLQGIRVDLDDACYALKQYNKRLDLDSKGAVLFREWIAQYDEAEYLRAGKLFAIPFDPTDSVNTPRTLANKPLALEKLARAVLVMKRAKLKLDVALGDAQFIYRKNAAIALHGGSGSEGIANVIGQWNYEATAKQYGGTPIEGSRWLTDKGYPITYGTSFVLSLSYTDIGPVAEALLTYGESGDPTSEHYTDQTKLFSEKRWRPVLYTNDEIDKNVLSTVVLRQAQTVD